MNQSTALAVRLGSTGLSFSVTLDWKQLWVFDLPVLSQGVRMSGLLSPVGSRMLLQSFFLESDVTMWLNVRLLFMFWSIQRGISQPPEWSAELEVSGETEWIPQPDFVDDTYWSGSAPLCLGGCRALHQEVRRDRCGNSSCCWLGYKSLCRVNCGRPDVDYNGLVYGNDWWVGSVVRYTCRSGFMLIGNPTRSCQANGLWTPKPACLRMCRRGRIEISEGELNGTCDSTCAFKGYFGPPKQGCTRIDNCKKKESGWKRFFAQCVPCICDCALSCASAG